jgi:hypothetical protein
MALKEGNLTRNLPNVRYGLSARRLWEHTQHRQINPFKPINYYSATTPEAYVDVVDITTRSPVYLGVTLEDFRRDCSQWVSDEFADVLLASASTTGVYQWLQEVGWHLQDTYERRAVRNAPTPFLKTGKNAPLAIPGLNCALADWLQQHGSEKASAHQWLNRIQNLTGKGLKHEEIDISHIKDVLAAAEPTGAITGHWLHDQLDYRQLRISIIPAVETASNHLTWRPAPPVDYIKRIKPKIKGKLPSTAQWRDPVLGYWIDMVEWDDLFGTERRWMAFNHRGIPLVTTDRPTGIYDAPEDAKSRANQDAGKVLPRLSSKGNWARYRLTGGENYREWLITLPYYPPTYFSSHYAHRNVLLHVRSDIRESADGEKVLFLQEVQSDWAQQARREMQEYEEKERKIPPPPWLQEWPALALKLMLLHAAERGCDALAWTTGDEQIKRYAELGEDGLRELYDRTLPKEADRILKPFTAKRGLIDIFLPVNFFIEPTDSGYAVLDSDNTLLGTAPTWRQAQSLIPDGAHELLGTMHGIRLNQDLSQSILTNGFYAWGAGLK